MITIYINGKPECLETTQTLYDYLLKTQPLAKHVAVILNNQFIPRPNYETISLREADRIELIMPMQGG